MARRVGSWTPSSIRDCCLAGPVVVDTGVFGARLTRAGVPATAEQRAMWTLLDAHEGGFSIERRFAEYDIEAVTSALDTEHYPSADWLTAKFHRAN